MSMHSDLLTVLTLDREEIIKRMDPYFVKLDDGLPLTCCEQEDLNKLMAAWESLTDEIDSEWDSTPQPEKKSFFNRIFRKL